jgi:hypothetical protein
MKWRFGYREHCYASIVRTARETFLKERGFQAAQHDIFERTENSKSIDSTTLKRPEGRAPVHFQPRDFPRLFTGTGTMKYGPQ